VVRGSASFGWQDMQTVLRVLITSAQERLRLATAYFAPDAYFIDLLAGAARRGVQVEILLPGPHTDQRACLLAGRQHYQTLVDAGVDVREYQPTMLHTKIVTVDGVCALIGSTNFNRRSMEHDEEVVLAVLDEDFTAALDADFDADRKLSEPIDPARWRRRPLPERLTEAVVTPIRRFL
jgi:cardiolipin synthase